MDGVWRSPASRDCLDGVVLSRETFVSSLIQVCFEKEQLILLLWLGFLVAWLLALTGLTFLAAWLLALTGLAELADLAGWMLGCVPWLA